ncbi:hypothetical protein [Neisseria polysaccharea]|nr:hypothetical protein [Neisseria polysaccharea]
MPSERRRRGIKAIPAARPIPERQCSATARVLLTNMRLHGTIAH